MFLIENKQIQSILLSLKTGMIEYIKPGETTYTEKDVDQCIKLIQDFFL